MREVGQILESYAYQNEFIAYGFGGIVKTDKDKGCQHQFNLNFEKDARIKGLPGLLSTYRNSLSNIELYGPTHFQHILKETIKVIQNTNKDPKIEMYHILLILTDGCVHDMRQTVDLIVEGCEYPLSIIIIGIGSADFKNMDILDSDDAKLHHSNGSEAQRDIVQFVKFENYSDNIGKLADEVLGEIPD
jgi:hypothetical protein